MKTKIKDLTPKQVDTICGRYSKCERCPLFRGWYCLGRSWEIPAEMQGELDKKVSIKK